MSTERPWLSRADPSLPAEGPRGAQSARALLRNAARARPLAKGYFGWKSRCCASRAPATGTSAALSRARGPPRSPRVTQEGVAAHPVPTSSPVPGGEPRKGESLLQTQTGAKSSTFSPWDTCACPLQRGSDGDTVANTCL